MFRVSKPEWYCLLVLLFIVGALLILRFVFPEWMQNLQLHQGHAFLLMALSFLSYSTFLWFYYVRQAENMGNRAVHVFRLLLYLSLAIASGFYAGRAFYSLA